MSGPVYPTPLTIDRINKVMQAVTLLIFNVSQPFDAAAYSQVRVAWQTQGQPSQQISDDVTYVSCVEEDDAFNRLRDFTYKPTAPVTELVTYTRVWRVDWFVYGPNSFDNARKIRSALFTQPIHDYLSSGSGANPDIDAPNLYWVTDAGAPTRAPEFRDGQWWERVDFSAQFNEATYETSTPNIVTSAEVKVYTPNSPDINTPVLDITVT